MINFKNDLKQENNNKKNRDQIWRIKKIKNDEIEKTYQFYKLFKTQFIIKRKGAKYEELIN